MANVKLFVGLFTSLLVQVLLARNVHEMEVDVEKISASWKLTEFKTTNCSISGSNRLLYFEELTISHDPIPSGQKEVFSVILQILKELGQAPSKLSAQLEVYRRTGSEWMDMCSIIPCTFPDFCEVLEALPFCPLKSCKCPIEHQTFNNPDLEVNVPQFPPGLSGTFNLTLTLKEDQLPISCTNIVFCLGQCS